MVSFISYWKLDESASGSYEDSIGTNHGACAVSCPTPVSGKVNGGQSFSGTKGILIPYSDTYNFVIGSSFSLECWVRKATPTTANAVALGRNHTTAVVHWWIGIGYAVEPQKVRMFIRDSANKGYGVSGTTTITDGEWHHIVGIQDAGAAEIRVYVDGVLEGTTPTAYTGNFTTSLPKLALGYIEGFTQPLVGDLDEVAIYNGVLTQEEISTHYSNGLIGIGYIPDEGGGIYGSSTITLDSITNDSTGTLSVVGNSSVELSSVSSSTDGALSIFGQSNITLDDLSQIAIAEALISGQSESTLDSIITESTGIVSDAPVIGSSSVVLDSLINTGTGSISISGNAFIQLDNLSSEANGEVTLSGVSETFLDGIISNYNGLIQIDGSSGNILDGIVMEATGNIFSQITFALSRMSILHPSVTKSIAHVPVVQSFPINHQTLTLKR
jgi:hypothetical protein